MEEMRLQKYLAQCGVASRRAAEQMIREGRIRVNGEPVTEMGVKVRKGDRVTADGTAVKPEKRKYYILLNKPAGILSSVKDDRGRECVVDLVAGIDARLYPVGRLDYDTTGLLLLTNDGDFMQKVTHPSFEVWKTYQAVVKGVPNETDIRKFTEGLLLDDGKTLPALLDVVGYKGNNAIVEVSLREGRNRQVRRMLEKIGHPVNSLKRIRFGSLELGDLKPGKWRHATQEELERLTEEW